MENTKFEKPYYSIYVYELSAGEIWVNDVPLVRWVGLQTADGDYIGEIPINQVVLENGEYELECKLLPRYGNKLLGNSSSYDLYNIAFQCREVNVLKSSIVFHPEIDTPSSGNWDENKKKFISDVFNDLPVYISKTKFKITELPFVLDGWQNSVDLSKIKEKVLFQDVLDYYRQIHAIMAAHNATKFLEISEEKMKLQEQAFYFTEERKKSFRAGAISLFSQKLAPLPLVPSNLKLQIMGYGRLVRLLQLDGSAALQYASPKPEEQSNIELDVKLHMRSQEKGFSII